mgnify:CR=1 FL=1
MSFLDARGLVKSYTVGASALMVLRDLDLVVEAGEMVAIVGASGVGKSTLLHVLGGLDRADAGSIRIAETEITALPDAAVVEFRNRHVGFVFQFHHLLREFSALENVMMPLLIAGVGRALFPNAHETLAFGVLQTEAAGTVVAALDAGLTPIVCIGEQLADREAGQEACVVQDQLEPIKALGAEVVSKLVLAYEPVWAIGTGLTATPEQAQQMHQQIRAYMESDQVRILYGGSVKADNAAELFAMPDIDGALVGGASLDAQEFLRIVAA